MSLFQGRSKLFIAAVIAIPVVLLFTLMSCIGSTGKTTVSDVTGTPTSSASAISTPEPAPVVPEPAAPLPPAPPVIPAPVPEPPAPIAAPAAPAPPQSITYGSCADVKAAGAAPIHQGQPGYSRKLDRDGDGIACEK